MEDKQTFSTGALRNLAKGRGAFELLCPLALKGLAIHFEKGADAHGSRNFERGMPIARTLQSALRHSFEFLEGKDFMTHCYSALWNWLVIAETFERIKIGALSEELNDLKDIPLWKFNNKEESNHINIDKLKERVRDLKKNEFTLPEGVTQCEGLISNQDVPSAAAQEELLARVDEEFNEKV